MFKIATIEDVYDIYNLNTELFVVLNELKENVYNPVAFPESFIKSMINSQYADYILVIDDEKVIGYILIEERVSPFREYDSFVEDHYAFIYEIVMLPEYRNKGYGKEAIEQAVIWAKDRKLTSIELNALSNNYSALAFYDRTGFKEFQVKLRKEI